MCLQVPVPSGTEQYWFWCMGYFSRNSKRSNMQKTSLYFRDIFLEARGYMQILFWKLSSECRFFPDWWHVRHKPHPYQTYLFNVANLILDIDLGASTSHITSRSLWHIQLSFFQVSLLFISFAAFVSLFVFLFVWMFFAWFCWTLVVILMNVSL